MNATYIFFNLIELYKSKGDFDNAKKYSKKYIKESESSGKQVLMVSNLMSGKGIQRKLEKDFDGYNFIFNSKGMLTHPYYIDWIRESIDNYSE